MRTVPSLRVASLLALVLATGCPSSTDDKDHVDDTGTPADTDTTPADCAPRIAQVFFELDDGSDLAAGQAAPADNPADSLAIDVVVGFRVELAGGFDPSGATWTALYCPDTATPAAGNAECTGVSLAIEGQDLVGSTADLGAPGCADPSIRFGLSVVADGHPCGDLDVLSALPGPLRFVVPDCDADGSTVAQGDCDDDDPARHPAATDVCGGADLDCEGAPAAGVWADDLGVTGTPSDLQAALDSGTGAVFSLCAGTWPALSIARDTTLIGVGGSTEVVIDAAGVGSAVSTAAAGAPVALTLEGLQITGADAAGSGGGIDGSNVSALTVRDCDIHGNSALEAGGIYAVGDTTIENSAIHDNEANHGGGLVVIGDLTMDLASSVEANLAATAAGLSVTDGEATLNDTVVSANIATGGGGGIELRGTTTLTGGTVTANEASFGAGLRPRSTTTFSHTLSDVQVVGNVSDRSGAGMSAFPSVEGLLTMTDMRFEDNEAGLKGAGIYLEGPLGGEMDIDLSNIDMVGNLALEEGGGLWAKDVTGTIRDSTADGNTSLIAGGGMFLKTAHVTLDNVTLVGNAAADPAYVAPAYPSGGGLAVEGTAELELLAIAVDTNTAERGGGISVSGPSVVHLRSGTVGTNTGTNLGDGGMVALGVLTGCDPNAVSWSGDIGWTDGGGMLQAFVPSSGCFEVGGAVPAATQTCACP